jgi:hypothetical protein
MTKTPKWLPDGLSIDPESLDGGTVVETVNGFSRARHAVGPIVRVFADVTPSRPDPRVEVVARVLHQMDPSHDLTCEDQDWAQWRVDASAILDALDTMDPDPEQWER